MALTTQQLNDLDKALKPGGGIAKFRHGDVALTVRKAQIADFELGLLVYINGTIDASWGFAHEDNEDNDENEKANHQLAKLYWMARSSWVYPPNIQKKAIKQLGKRAANQRYDFSAKRHYWTPFFSSFSTLKTMLTRLDGITLKSIGHQNQPSALAQKQEAA
jgi:hypothetical protein